jgi:predicted DNA-binding ribbon-helix-helix protein
MAKSRNKRSIMIAGHRTSVSLEDAFWDVLGELAAKDGRSIAALIEEIDKRRSETGQAEASLSAAIRLHVLERLRKASQRI